MSGSTSMKTPALVIERVRLSGAHGEIERTDVDLHIADGRIAQIVPTGSAPAADGAEVVDGAGALALPGTVDAHCHVDKTLWGRPWRPHTAGPVLEDRIRNGEEGRAELGLPAPDTIRALLKQMIATGTTAARTHTDVDPEIGLAGLERVAEAAEELKHAIDVQQVAFPQGGLLIRPGTAELLEEALRRGLADVVGGIDPAALERDSVRHLDTVFGLAATYGARVDIHLHERGTLGAHTMELAIEHTRRHGLAGRVTLSHAVAVAEVDAAQAARIRAGLAEQGISLVTATVYNTPVLPIADLARDGVNVGAGNDGVRDLWGPWGLGDMLERTHHLAYRSGYRTDEQIARAFDVAVTGGAIAMGREPARIAPGAPADLFLVGADGIGEAVAARPVRRLVVKNGAVVARDGQTLDA
ncbi:amidohydrolase [Microbacterium capsulatum]|uniref:Amidohydrolase n=1 Tax=Microbacterium capsulatum TaxID=3041921 RepID=A0ABU0XER3_9MICO|nr:amidohydrolase [Microbacterium sp. ASV81]MDQ4213601.1 amidohydrolase [Microbacterium sp. ASV81]